MFRPAFVLFTFFSLLTGLVYPGLITVAGQALFPAQANGSLIRDGEKILGSSLIGREFREAKYFSARPSATLAKPYDASASLGSNLGPTNPALAKLIDARRDADPGAPPDLLTSSASGLDPHISPAAAAHQAPRVARARGMSLEQVVQAIERHTEGRTWEILGEPRVNVLELNLDLDRHD